MRYQIVHQNVGGEPAGAIIDEATYPLWQWGRLVEAGAVVEHEEPRQPSAAERKAAEREAARLAKEEADRRAAEEAARLEAEKAAK